jgi:hypothetical protein
VECLAKTIVSHLRRSSGLKLDLWNCLRGFLWNQTLVNQIAVPLCVCVFVCLFLLVICSSLSLSKFSCIDLDSNLKCCS